MKKIITYVFAGLLLCSTTVLTSCSDFEDININPNRVSYGNVTPTKLLQDIIFEGQWIMLSNSVRINGELIQYSLHTNTLIVVSNYDIRSSQPLALWRGLYRWASAADHMYRIALEQEDTNCQAIALTMKVYYAETIASIFGDMPYGEAFRWAEEIYYPAFDPQIDVYAKMLDELDDANFLYDHDTALDFPARDLLYNGDTKKWQKFTNSLRLRLLMRISKCTEVDVPAQMALILDNPTIYPVFTSNADAAILYYTGEPPFFNNYGASGSYDPMHNSTRLGKTLTDIMNACSDPRLPKYAQARSGGTYEGMLAGQTSDYIADNLSTTTYYNPALSTNTSPSTLMNYSEVLFIQAEAALRGLISGTPKSLYEAAVTASVRQWCGESTNIGAMLATDAAYNGTIKQIMEQKYVAQILVGFEAWCDYRRTGFPFMPTGPAMGNLDNSGNPVLPTRLVYPIVTQTTNYEKYREAVERMGGKDDMFTKVWWAAGTRY